MPYYREVRRRGLVLVLAEKYGMSQLETFYALQLVAWDVELFLSVAESFWYGQMRMSLGTFQRYLRNRPWTVKRTRPESSSC